ncbi:hypothetical protein ACFY15_10350 [Streptomyces sp. NPDC001373]|uniref:hypothetical protein n=1 Tax=Streptomyces sp. NPDC001373 TaxID=3364565 RepID=UPI0036AB7C26
MATALVVGYDPTATPGIDATALRASLDAESARFGAHGGRPTGTAGAGMTGMSVLRRAGPVAAAAALPAAGSGPGLAIVHEPVTADGGTVFAHAEQSASTSCAVVHALIHAPAGPGWAGAGAEAARASARFSLRIRWST